MSRFRFLEAIRQDLWYALRGMHNHAGFSLLVVLIIALGIGANTAMFSVVHAILLKPLPYHEPERLVVLTRGATPVRFDEMMSSSRSYAAIGAYAGSEEEMALSGVGEPEVLKVARVSANFLDLLGVTPVRGRSFIPEEDKPGAPAVAIISSELWQRRLGNDPSVIGKTITLAGATRLIVGVLPAGFQFPFAGVDVWVSKPKELSMIPPGSRPLSPTLRIFGRLKADINLREANAELDVLHRQYATAHPAMLDAKLNPPERVRALQDVLVDDVRPKLWMLLGAVGLVLLIVCANIAGLLLARATSRSREFAVRAAIGAPRSRIIAQLLGESIFLASIGGALGIVFSDFNVAGIRGMTFLNLPRAGEIRMDGPVLAFAVALSVLTGVLFGLAPSLVLSRPDLAAVLKGSGAGAASGRSRSLLRFGSRGFLIVGQVALSIVLLIGATLLIRSLVHLNGVDPGFQPSNLLTMSISLSPVRYDTAQKRAAFYEQLVKNVASLPGISGAAITRTLPMSGWAGSPVQIAEAPLLKLNERPIAVFENITPEYFRTMEIPLRRGREFTSHDIMDSVLVVVISETLARTLWPQYPGGPNPIGQHILIGKSNEPLEIVGIVADVRQNGKGEDPMPELYLACAQGPPPSAMLVARTNGDPLAYANTVRNQILTIDHDQPVSAVASMDQLIEASEGQLNLIMKLLEGFALAATFLALLGLYGSISYSVVQRTREIGIRSALGAQRGNILSLILGYGFRLSLAGILLGACAALALTRFLRGLLFHVSATDPLTFVVIPALFLFVAITASYIPARRASTIDPLAALRHSE